MGLRDAVRRTALARPGVLLVTWPGASADRLAAERELRRRGWPLVEGPAAADLLVVVGAPGTGTDADTGWLEAVWGQMPAPRERVDLYAPERMARQLDAAASHLASPAPPPGHSSARDTEGDTEGDSHQHHGHASHDEHPGHDMDGDHAGDHAGHDMGGMEVAGLPMADRADDRDGLRLDLLHVPLGPALNDWPCGLVLRTALQGDVIQEAEADHLAVRAGRAPFWNEPWLRAARGEDVTRGEAARRRCAAHLDSLGRFLAVAGWRDAAARARRLRDLVLADGVTDPYSSDDLLRLVRQVSRSRTLRWLTVGLGPLPAARAQELGISGPGLVAGGDVHDRVRVWLDEVARSVGEFDDAAPLGDGDVMGPRGRVDGPRPPSAALLDALVELLRGAEFATARLIVASLDPDIDELAVAVPAPGVTHG
ncbi:hypothetical protein [Streptomyces sp. NPDC002845]